MKLHRPWCETARQLLYLRIKRAVFFSFLFTNSRNFYVAMKTLEAVCDSLKKLRRSGREQPRGLVLPPFVISYSRSIRILLRASPSSRNKVPMRETIKSDGRNSLPVKAEHAVKYFGRIFRCKVFCFSRIAVTFGATRELYFNFVVFATDRNWEVIIEWKKVYKKIT